MICVKTFQNISKCLLLERYHHLNALMNRVLSYYFDEKEY